MSELCPEDAMSGVTQVASTDTRQGLRRTEALLANYPDDPRLHFLRGSLLAALEHYSEAEEPMREAIELAPGFHIARFQLGLLYLTSGAYDAACDVWAPLSQLPVTDPLRLFAEGLRHMAQDDFSSAERLLRDGLANNSENPALNHDMQMMLDRMLDVAGNVSSPVDEHAASQAHWLLRVSASKQTKH